MCDDDESIGPGDVVREKVFDVAREASSLPERMAVAVESTPTSFFRGLRYTGFAGTLLVASDQLFDWNVLLKVETFSDLVALVTVQLAFLGLFFSGGLGTLPEFLARPRRKVEMTLYEMPPRRIELFGPQSLADEISGFRIDETARERSIFVTTAETGTVDLFAAFQRQAFVGVKTIVDSSLKDALKESFEFEKSESLATIGRLVSQVVTLRSLGGGPPSRPWSSNSRGA